MTRWFDSNFFLMEKSLNGRAMASQAIKKSNLLYYVQVAERPNATVCKTVKPSVQIRPWIPSLLGVNRLEQILGFELR
jgi:hypothetical protein